MKNSPRFLLRNLQHLSSRATRSTACHGGRPRFLSHSSWKRNLNPGDNPEFTSIIDGPAKIVRAGKRHGPGLIILAIIPITAFALGTWQIQRLGWKSALIAKFEDRLIRDPLPLPPHVEPSVVGEFDYRRVYCTGRFRHDQEMLIGPRMRDGEDGYLVVTPLERDASSAPDPSGNNKAIIDSGGGDKGSTILVNRGWISKKHRDQRTRPDGLPRGRVTVEGLLREPWKKNMFTPENRPDKGEFYFPDVRQMAALTGAQPVWIEATQEPEWMQMVDYQTRGIPFGRPAEVNLRNNHAQYIFTWYGLAVATSIMMYMVVKKPSSEIARRVRATRNL